MELGSEVAPRPTSFLRLSACSRMAVQHNRALTHSYRSASIGSIREAFTAG